MSTINVHGLSIPAKWRHGGRTITRPATGLGCSVIGGASIVRDPNLGGYRMFLFFDPPGHGQSFCRSLDQVGPGHWSFPVPVEFTNPEVLPGTTHKPWIVQDAHRPNEAALIDGRYCLLSVGIEPNKYVHRAWANSLAGPWTWEPDALIGRGGPGSFDEKHVDAVSGFYFPQRREILYFYMGYPQQAQARTVSPYGSASAAAVEHLDKPGIVKLGEVLPPCQQKGHWAAGWVGGMQLIPGTNYRWVGLYNASPTAPDPANKEIWTEEPPPSLGGFAVCDEEFPTRNWRWMPEPIEWMKDVPPEARANGEEGNFWRHHILVLPGGGVAMFYSAGHYGKEQSYMKFSVQP